jgi:hypothetical protein
MLSDPPPSLPATIIHVAAQKKEKIVTDRIHNPAVPPDRKMRLIESRAASAATWSSRR